MAMNIPSILKWILGIVLGVVLTGAVALGGWNLKRTAEIPVIYPTKQELKDAVKHAEDDRAKIRSEVADDIDDMRVEQRYIRDTVDDIKNILINRGQ